MARPRKPMDVLKRQGTAQRCRLEQRKSELDYAGDFPAVPGILSGAALEEWHRVRSISGYAECIRDSDMAILTAYCTLWGKLCAKGDLRASEWVVFISLCGKLGMSPADRTKVKVERDEEEQNPFRAYALGA